MASSRSPPARSSRGLPITLIHARSRCAAPPPRASSAASRRTIHSHVCAVLSWSQLDGACSSSSGGGSPPEQAPAAGGGAGSGADATGGEKKKRERGNPWTEDEHKLFLQGLEKFGKGNWRNISRQSVLTRTPVQVASHAQKYFIRQSLHADVVFVTSDV